MYICLMQHIASRGRISSIGCVTWFILAHIKCWLIERPCSWILWCLSYLKMVFMICTWWIVQKMVIQTKSVQYMPFTLSLASFLNGVVWTSYAVLPFDINLVVSASLRHEFDTVMSMLRCKLMWSSFVFRRRFPMVWVLFSAWHSWFSMHATTNPHRKQAPRLKLSCPRLPMSNSRTPLGNQWKRLVSLFS